MCGGTRTRVGSVIMRTAIVSPPYYRLDVTHYYEIALYRCSPRLRDHVRGELIVLI